MRSFGSTFQPRRNSLNVLRLVMAVGVVVSHAPPLRNGGTEPALVGTNIGTWSVIGFFIVSGALITRSRLSRSTWEYTRDRVLRIFPAFLAVTVLIAFVVSPLSLLFTEGSTWSVGSAVKYVVTNLPLGGGFSFRQDSVGTTLAGLELDVWNGATWTLIFEAFCYVAIAVAVAIIPRRLLVSALVAAWVLLAAVAQVGTSVDVPKAAHDLATFGAAFCIGAIFWLKREWVPVGPIAGVAAAVVFVVSASVGLQLSVAPVALAIVILCLSWLVPVNQIGSHDLSYGLYVWGWPVQQFTILVFGAGLAAGVNLAIVLAATFALAWLSAVYVEEPALRLKRRSAAPAAQSSERVAVQGSGKGGSHSG